MGALYCRSMARTLQVISQRGRVPDMSIADDGYEGSAKRPDSDNDKS